MHLFAKCKSSECSGGLFRHADAAQKHSQPNSSDELLLGTTNGKMMCGRDVRTLFLERIAMQILVFFNVFVFFVEKNTNSVTKLP